MNSKFDQDGYWIARHKRLVGDPRSVGNIGKTVKENLAGEKRIREMVNGISRGLKPYHSVLDVGCGYGRIADIFCNNGYEYTGADVSAEAIKAAKEFEPRGKYLVGSAANINLGGPYDLVCASYVLVHFVDDEVWRNLLLKLVRKLNPGGGLLIIDDFPDTDTRPAEHVSQRSRETYSKFFKDAGLVQDDEFAVDPAINDRSFSGGMPLILARKTV